MERVRVGNYDTVRAGRSEIAQWIADTCLTNKENLRRSKPVCVFSSNGQGIALRGKNSEFDAAMDAAEVIHADGMPVVMASKYLTKTPIQERSSTTDLFHDVTQVAVQKNLNFFVLGGSEELNQRTVAAMKAQYPELNIVGAQHGYFGRDEDADVCRKIVEAETDVLWVGLGKPLQEIWSHQNSETLRGVGCIKTCGGLYSFLVGDAPRAPEWMQKLGLEWFFRLINDPRRLFKRYLITNTVSAWRLLTQTG